MAEVFLAEAKDEKGVPFKVALKLMRKDVTAEAFADEADLMGLLEHPNLVSRLEIGEAFGRYFIAMEFLVGGDLEGLLRAHESQGSPPPVAVGVHVCIEVLRALAYFHQARTRSGRPLELIHGDVNPSNIFFSGQCEVKLGDFGVAKARGLDLGPEDGVTAGKLHYLSPEQTRGDTVTQASDLFSMGIVLHELVLGFHPFARNSDDPEVVMAAIRAAKLSLPDKLDRQLGVILRKALAPDVNQRYRTAGEFAGALFTWALDTGQPFAPRELQPSLQQALSLALWEREKIRPR
ncbi:serine/threonine protein kinase [Archangium minus]|uniref:Serine/threonine protein kinase n=2 Tax=Archangium minus TaxID=83450 RepID=A0ABY9XBS6_9BACT|nr:serine/threonine protein kinase [Archangium minus]